MNRPPAQKPAKSMGTTSGYSVRRIGTESPAPTWCHSKKEARSHILENPAYELVKITVEVVPC